EAIIFESSGQLLAKVGSFLVESETAPPLWSFLIADEGDIAVFPNVEKTKVRALMKVQRAIPTYLFIGKDVDSNVLGRVERVDITANEYLNITKKLDYFQFQFNQLFIAINFLMILLSVWFGLMFSNRIIEPIMQIIKDSEKIIEEDFSTRIRIFSGNNEYSILSNVLNKMLNILNDQKNKLFRAKETINLRRKFTEKIINNVSTGIIYIDLNNNVLLCNKVSQKIFENKIKKNYLSENLELKNILIKYKQNQNKNYETQIKFIATDKLKFLNIKISQISEKKKIKGFVLSVDDVSELVSAQKNAAWSSVARYMAHEIKNPLTPIKLSAQRLERYFKSNYGNEQILDVCTETIKRQVNNIQNLVTEFSNFARMPEQQLKNSLLKDIIETQINTIKVLDNKTKIISINEHKSLKIMCDQNQLGRVFLNILKNSHESSMKKNKRIVVEVIKKKKDIIINIEDNGVGFPENRDKLFEPYITNKINGTGLGLAICKKIIEDHNGKINLLDSKKHGGACVSIKLPVS
ncbi:MAG: sensor histidine kinase, partial [Alphaproteobacteria bacterium]